MTQMPSYIAPPSYGKDFAAIPKPWTTANDPYTEMTEEQIRNIDQTPDPFFFFNGRRTADKDAGIRPRYAYTMSQNALRGMPTDLPHLWVGERWNRNPPYDHNTCRGRASVRWGPDKQGEKTRSHYFGEDVARYTTIDTYRRPSTNLAGRVTMDYGRPADGYYAQKYPTRSTWCRSSVPLNNKGLVAPFTRKTYREYEEQKRAEILARGERIGKYPEFSEYTNRYLLRAKTCY
ncbi:hypothetical protein NP493_448g01045 [Ridgeia piscesae]|uniref:Uncharacterized protein n=1 Tax=Ridgeia piscesae TaxID=27915 RepID=A0AAD9NUV1_RIDPI|nr:hypothetical protein NP493_448g01045 [Ridgeia piscesae]